MTSIRKFYILLTFIFLVKLLSCKEKPNSKEKNSKKDSLSEQINKSIDEFEKRPIFKILTIEIIDQTSDENLLQVVFDNLNEKLPKDYDKEYQTVLSWNKSRQAIYMTWWLEAEVNNGGFNQYYSNSSGAFAEFAPEALKLIGATEIADLATKANKVYKQEYDKITKHQDGTVEGFSKSYENNPLNKLDDEFYELTKTQSLQPLQVKYIRSHKEQFLDK